MTPLEISDADREKAADDYMADVKDFRKQIDACIQRSEAMLEVYPRDLRDISCAREISLVRTKLQEAKMWAGKILEVLGSPFPAELADKASGLGSIVPGGNSN
jgi:hypothetical protein